MSLSARERILKLRETEFKLQRLQNDLLNGENDREASASVTEFLDHHKELMSLPGSSKNRVPFRYNHEAPKRYVDIDKKHKLTLPPKVDMKSKDRLKDYKEPVEDLERSLDKNSGSIRQPNLAIHTFLHELSEDGGKTSVGYPRVDKFALANKTTFSKNVQPLNSQRYVKIQPSLKSKNSSSLSNKSFTNNNLLSSGSTSYLYLRDESTAESIKRESDNNRSKSGAREEDLELIDQVSKIASATASILIATQDSLGTSSKFTLPDPTKTPTASRNWNIPRTQESAMKHHLAYALGTSDLMGVILPPDKKVKKKKLTTQWIKGPSYIESDFEKMTANDALHLLRRRKAPERKPILPVAKPPHKRGLVGVEISEFLPQCSFFYRDRKGNYNPHLYHSKAVTESMKKNQNSKSTILIKP